MAWQCHQIIGLMELAFQEMDPLPGFALCFPIPMFLTLGLDTIALPKVDNLHFGNVSNYSSN